MENDDLIPRESVRDILADEFRLANAHEEKIIGRINYRVKSIPAVDAVEVVHSEWQYTGIKDEWYGPVFQCKSCGGEMIGNPLFCPDCGAHMDGRREDGDA